MRFYIGLLTLFLIVFPVSPDKIIADKNDIAIIVEVDQDPSEVHRYINSYWPTVEVVATYTELFRGLALKVPAKKLNNMIAEPFVQGVHPVKTYEMLPLENIHDNHFISKSQFSAPQKFKNEFSTKFQLHNAVLPVNFNKTKFTGKGVKVAVIDTGIDWQHPDLKKNFSGGFDLVDLDADPMETTLEQGIPTFHGTHVAGIIGANGTMKGVAPDSELYVYRALGPGGIGTSIQVIAAMEEAVKEGVDIINMSLGASVNGPDYPTSKAVNEASKRGIAVVVANGNTGPNRWTVGAPATATSSISVGAYESARKIPYLYEPNQQKKIPLSALPNHQNWNFQRDDIITTSLNSEVLNGNIWLMTDENVNINQLVDDGAKAMIIPRKFASFFSAIDPEIAIPIAFISDEDANWLNENKSPYFQHKFEERAAATALFSSRGPVNGNWDVKPDMIAPGVNILSTIPGGYSILSGTSMAAPHVAGAIAVMKEAKPFWSHEKIIGALQTTAIRMTNEDDTNESPTDQGAGLIQIKDTIDTDTIIYNPMLTLGKTQNRLERKNTHITIENTTEQEQHYTFEQPKKIKGIQWQLPLSFTLHPHEKKRIPIKVTINDQLVDEAMNQNYLTLRQKNHTYHLPFLVVTNEVDNPTIAGFSLEPKEWDDDMYQYELYITEPVQSVQIQLYDPDTMLNKGVLWKWTDLKEGMNGGEIPRVEIKQRGLYDGLIIIQLENGEIVNEFTEIFIQ